MKISELIEESEAVLKERGDVDVHVFVRYEEKCDSCGCSREWSKSGRLTGVSFHGDDFTIEGVSSGV